MARLQAVGVSLQGNEIPDWILQLLQVFNENAAGIEAGVSALVALGGLVKWWLTKRAPQSSAVPEVRGGRGGDASVGGSGVAIGGSGGRVGLGGIGGDGGGAQVAGRGIAMGGDGGDSGTPMEAGAWRSVSHGADA